MALTLYSDLPARRTVQLTVDLLALACLLLAVWVGTQVDDGVDEVAAQVVRGEEAGDSLAGGLTDAGDQVAQVPLVGDEVRAPFDRAAEASGGLARTAGDAAQRLDVLGTWLGTGTALVLVAVLAAAYLPPRLRFVLTATAVRRLRAAGTGRDDDLLALRALAQQPVHVLARRVPDAAAGWRRGDPATVRALADLELRAVGLAPSSPAGRTVPDTGPADHHPAEPSPRPR